MTGNLALSFREASRRADIAGEKGASLGRLAAAGFRVPGGFVLSTAAYEEFINAAGLGSLIDRVSCLDADPYSDATLLALDRIRLRCLRATLPDAVRTELVGALIQSGLFGAPLAVRSSAIDEDSVQASFAGIHRTLLNVLGMDALENAVRACWASLWTPRAVLYRQRTGTDGKRPGMAVIVQRLVQADAAGVVFTREPTTGTDQVIINSSWGLGESVASGRVTPDTFIIGWEEDKPVLQTATTGEKSCLARPTVAGGITWHDTTLDQRRRLSLTTEQAMAIAETARRIEEVLGQAQDIEWARVGDEVLLLQARPMTGERTPRAAAVDDEGDQETPLRRDTGGDAPDTLPWGTNIWSSANLVEVIPRVPSPLSWSLSHLALEHGFQQVFHAVRYGVPPGTDMARRFAGRPYFNLAAFQWLFWDAFGLRPEALNRALGGQQPTIGVDAGNPLVGRAGLSRRWRRLRGALIGAHTVRRANAYLGSLTRHASRLEAQQLAAKSDLELLELLFEEADAAMGFFSHFLFVSMWSGAMLQSLGELVQRRLGDEGLGLTTSLLAGAGRVCTAEQGYLLERVAQAAAAEERARSFFQGILNAPEDSSAMARRWREALSGTRAGALFGEFLERYGHRAVFETEVMQPRWQEDPAYPLEVVATMLAEGEPTRQEPAERARAARAQVEERMGLLQRVRLRCLLHGACQGSRQRENFKSALVRQLGLHRRMALEIGGRMARARLLARADDIFFLRMEEIRPYLLGESVDGDLRGVVAGRRRQFEAAQALAHPEVVVGDALPSAGEPTDATGGGARDGAQREYLGLGVSGGKAQGPARVLRHPAEGRRLRAGDILVAPAVDPSWTPLFLRAGAVLMESGGFLSHAAIVAREFGVPAVSNIAGIVDQVADGALLEVDGDTGQVRLLD